MDRAALARIFTEVDVLLVPSLRDEPVLIFNLQTGLTEKFQPRS